MENPDFVLIKFFCAIFIMFPNCSEKSVWITDIKLNKANYIATLIVMPDIDKKEHFGLTNGKINHKVLS